NLQRFRPFMPVLFLLQCVGDVEQAFEFIVSRQILVDKIDEDFVRLTSLFRSCCRRPTNHTARISADYPIKRLPMGVKPLDDIHLPFILALWLSGNAAPEILEHLLGGRLEQRPAVGDMLRTQCLHDLFSARQDGGRAVWLGSWHRRRSRWGRGDDRKGYE